MPKEYTDAQAVVAVGTPSSSTPAASRLGSHHPSQDQRGLGVGAGFHPTPAPVKGAFQAPLYTPPHVRSESTNCKTMSSVVQSFGSALPPVNFPVFDGSNPKLWKSRCETFFEFYDVPREMWVKLAIMQFDGSAIFWLQSVES